MFSLGIFSIRSSICAISSLMETHLSPVHFLPFGHLRGFLWNIIYWKAVVRLHFRQSKSDFFVAVAWEQEDVQRFSLGDYVVLAHAAVISEERECVRGSSHFNLGAKLPLVCPDNVSEGSAKGSPVKENRSLTQISRNNKPCWIVGLYSGWVFFLFFFFKWLSLISFFIYFSTPSPLAAVYTNWILLGRMFHIMPEGCVCGADTSEWFIWLHHEHLGRWKQMRVEEVCNKCISPWVLLQVPRAEVEQRQRIFPKVHHLKHIIKKRNTNARWRLHHLNVTLISAA